MQVRRPNVVPTRGRSPRALEKISKQFCGGFKLLYAKQLALSMHSFTVYSILPFRCAVKCSPTPDEPPPLPEFSHLPLRFTPQQSPVNAIHPSQLSALDLHCISPFGCS
jgi:hypothetical protein